MFENEKQNAIWQTKDGKTFVIFNPNATQDQIIKEIATHEMTHDILNQKTDSGNNLFSEVLEYAKTTESYENMRKDLEKSYSKYYDITSKDFSQKIDEEVVAKTLEKQLGTQEYIARIVNNNTSLAQKIYRWIIDRLQTFNELIGFKSEKIYWESVKNKFEKAYRSQDYSNTKMEEIENPNKSRSNYKSSNRGKQGFNYYNVNLAYPIRSSNGDIIDYKYYESRLVVRKDNNNNFAYDLDDFEQKKGATLDKTSLSIVAGKPADGSFSLKKISQLNSKVNGDASSIKYFIQDIEKNTQRVSETLKKEIIYKIKNNLKNDTKIKYMNLNDLIELQNSQGGYRENNNEKLISSIKNETFKGHITLFLDSKGNVTIKTAIID